MSRLTSNKPEDIEWRVKKMRASSAIEGIVLDENHEKIYQELKDKGITGQQAIDIFVAKIKAENGSSR